VGEHDGDEQDPKSPRAKRPPAENREGAAPAPNSRAERQATPLDVEQEGPSPRVRVNDVVASTKSGRPSSWATSCAKSSRPSSRRCCPRSTRVSYGCSSRSGRTTTVRTHWFSRRAQGRTWPGCTFPGARQAAATHQDGPSSACGRPRASDVRVRGLRARVRATAPEAQDRLTLAADLLGVASRPPCR
jgi:hypothetical protein